MSGKEYTAKSVEEALEKALNEMMLTREDINYEVVQQPSKGFLGFGQKDAIVRVEKKAAEEPKVTVALKRDTEKSASKAEPVKEVKKESSKEIKKEVKKEVETAAEPQSAQNAGVPDAAVTDEVQDASAAKIDRAEALATAEEKGRAFLAKIFEEMDLDIVIEVQEKGGYLVFDLQGENLGILIGRRGDTLDALQFLLNLVINEKNSAKVKGIIDIENYRAKREETLIGLGHKLAAKARKTGQKVVLEPMNPQERRIIHMALQNDRRVTTYSEGDEPYRKVVIEPVAGAQKPYYKKNYNKNYNNRGKKQYHHEKETATESAEHVME